MTLFQLIRSVKPNSEMKIGSEMKLEKINWANNKAVNENKPLTLSCPTPVSISNLIDDHLETRHEERWESARLGSPTLVRVKLLLSCPSSMRPEK